jgi:HK97 family phage major capsid protein
VEDTSATAFVATAEQAAYDENEATVAQKDLILYKYTKVTKASEEFVAYNAVNFEAWLSDSLARAEAVLENTLYLSGTGTGEGQGVLAGATSGNIVTTSAVLVPADISALMGQLGDGYNVQGQTALIMKNATKWYLKGLPVNAAFAFSPTPNDFWGVPVVINDNMSAYTVASASGKSMLFGNFNYYGLVEKPGMMVQRNPYLYMATGQIGIFASIFRGGAVLQSEAFYYSVGK